MASFQVVSLAGADEMMEDLPLKAPKQLVHEQDKKTPTSSFHFPQQLETAECMILGDNCFRVIQNPGCAVLQIKHLID
jgi:hypothetical protein